MILGLTSVDSKVKCFNAASLGHLLKTGYRIYGRIPRRIFHEGHLVDELILAVFREDWEPVWEKYQKMSELPKLTPRQRARVLKETQ